MQLPPIFHKTPAVKPSYFFAIHLSDLVVQSALWKVDQGLIEVVSRSKQKSWTDDESCIQAIDQTLQELSKESESVKETLFALNPEWVTPEGILPAKKPLFQKITKELSLEAIGFVVTTEALLQHFTQTLSPQLSLFLIEVAETQLFVTQVKQGALQQTEKVGRSGEIIPDLIEAFAHFKDKVFPSKFLLYSSVLDQTELEEIRQTLFNHDWPKEYPFLHPPVIDVFAADHVLEIIIQTGGRAVAESKGLKLVSVVEQKVETKSMVEPMTDLATPEPVPTEPKLVVPAVAETALGPDEENPDANVVPVIEEADPIVAEEVVSSEVSAPHDPASTQPEKSAKAGFHLPEQLQLKHLLPFLGAGVVIGLLLLWGIGTLAAGQFKSALVTIQLDSKPVNKDVTLTLDPNALASDPTQQLLKATVVTVPEQGSKTASTSGSKLIGDKAKGSVTLYNRTSSSKVFSAGTTLTSGSLSFTLDSDVTIASASSGTDPTIINVGTATDTVTATVIGADSNLAKDTDLTIGNYAKDSYFARTASDLSGGSSREILAVSAADQAKLKASLLQDLLAQATTQFKKNSTNGQYQVATNQVKVVKTTYSADVGKEADTFSLDLQVEVTGLAYQASDLNPLATQLLSQNLPVGYVVNADQLQVLSNPVLSSSSSAQVKLQTNVSAVAWPTLDLTQLKQQIAGKSLTAATQVIMQHAGVKNVTVVETPGILKVFSSAIPSQLTKISLKTNE